jgi:hypothetical protein
MRIERLNDRTVAIGPLDLLSCELLQQIRVSAEPGNSRAVRERLFPSPIKDKRSELRQEWKEYVEPELAELFASHLDIIEKDLEGFPSGGSDETGHVLHVPVKHLDAWIHGLNQARLAIAARNNFTEKDMDSPIPFEGDVRALALFQVWFYGILEECFLRILGAE